MRPLGAQRGVVAVTHRVVAVHVEDPGGDVVEKFLERARLPRIADPARETSEPRVLPLGLQACLEVSVTIRAVT